MRNLGLLLVMALAAPVTAAPAADVVFIWAPGLPTAPVVQTAKTAGAAVFDRSPPPGDVAQNAPQLQKAIEAFDRGELDTAWRLLDDLSAALDGDGAAGMTRAQLSDVFLFRALVRTQQGDVNSAWEELVVAATIDPTRQLDPGRFPPTVRSEFDRARKTVEGKSRVPLELKTPPGCRLYVDGAIAAAVEVYPGRHWYRVTCREGSQGQRLEVLMKTSFKIEPPAQTPPPDAEMLVQARTAGARAFIVAEVHTNVATARLVGLDGRERDRRTVSISGDLGPLANAVNDLLAAGPERHWYQAKWVWISGGALAAAAVLVPLTAYFTRDTTSSTWDANVPSPPGWAP